MGFLVWNSVENGSEMLEIIVVNTLSLFCHYLPSECDPLFKHIEFPLQRDAFCKVWLKLEQFLVLEEKILKIRQCLFNMSVLSSFGKGCWPIFEQICIYFCFKCLKLFQWFWRGIPIFKSQSLFVAIVSPWKRAWPFIWTNLCRIIFVQGDWLKLIKPVVLIGKEDF